MGKSLKDGYDEIPTKKNLLEKSSNALKMHLDSSVTASNHTSPRIGYCYLPTEGFWFHTAAVKSAPLHSLSISINATCPCHLATKVAWINSAQKTYKKAQAVTLRSSPTCSYPLLSQLQKENKLF